MDHLPLVMVGGTVKAGRSVTVLMPKGYDRLPSVERIARDGLKLAVGDYRVSSKVSDHFKWPYYLRVRAA